MESTAESGTVFSPRAMERIQRITNHISEVGRAYGENGADHTGMLASFGQTLPKLIMLGGTITCDGQLGLYTVTSYGMHVGMVFHVDTFYRSSKSVGPYGAHVEWCLFHGAPLPANGTPCEGIRSDLTRDVTCTASASHVPVTGTWSLHS